MSETNSVVFNGAEIRYNDTRHDEGGVFNRIHIVFDPSRPVQEALGWEDLPESIPSGKLTGRIPATHVIFTPTDKQLQNQEMQFPVNEVRDFSFTSKHDKEGKRISRSIAAVVVTQQKVSALIENWLATVGEASAVCKVGYAVQEKLPLEEQTPLIDGKQKVLEMRTKPDAAEQDDPPASDNDLNAMGSGRQRKKRTRGGEEPDPAVAAELAEREALKNQLTEQLQ